MTTTTTTTTTAQHRSKMSFILPSLSSSVILQTTTTRNNHENSYANIPMTSYEPPDGQTIEVGADRFKIPDILFNPSLIQTFRMLKPFAFLLNAVPLLFQEKFHLNRQGLHPVPLQVWLNTLMVYSTATSVDIFLTIPGMETFKDSISSIRGLAQMVVDSINKCDVGIRRDLFSSVLLAGGTASMQQLKERLEKDLGEETPQAARVKVLASGNTTERRFSVWIGGSILASLGSFQQMWFSKTEYEEHGTAYIQRKCP